MGQKALSTRIYTALGHSSCSINIRVGEMALQLTLQIPEPTQNSRYGSWNCSHKGRGKETDSELVTSLALFSERSYFKGTRSSMVEQDT